MTFITHVARVVIVTLTLAPAAAAAVIDVPVMPLVIRLYAEPALGPETRTPALDEARRILADAGFAAEWLACAPGRPAADRCAVPMRGAELAVRIVSVPGHPDEHGRQTLGYSLVDPKTKAGTLATVYLDRVSWLAVASHADVAALLGRAIAHEIGHLLLGTAGHSPSGVMRAIWSSDSVRNSRADDWRFAPGEARQMQTAALMRAAATQLASR